LPPSQHIQECCLARTTDTHKSLQQDGSCSCQMGLPAQFLLPDQHGKTEMPQQSPQQEHIGCSKAITAVPPRIRTVCWMEFTIWNVVELSSPVDISSMKRARPGVTSISAAASISVVDELCDDQLLDTLLRN
ncbi:hypothetical protein E2562_027575, partial [Oryza meyeriana var. granulata]